MFESIKAYIVAWLPGEVSPQLKKSVESTIESNKLLVYSKTYCPYCTATKNLLNKHGVDYKLIELNTLPDGGNIQRALKEITGQRTVPNIFFNGKHIGGDSDLQALESKGELTGLLAKL
ncbi:GRX1 [Candida margitis]|uniref:GRX1 n=1 Tax=Candida margitis TaxID=1775924 RepID=UPI0022260AA3|nr:GRX1 [Candida margitis]KAI5970752.1 GRX1 [Candida margitis]